MERNDDGGNERAGTDKAEKQQVSIIFSAKFGENILEGDGDGVKSFWGEEIGTVLNRKN